jgi:hypothetical protein
MAVIAFFASWLIHHVELRRGVGASPGNRTDAPTRQPFQESVNRLEHRLRVAPCRPPWPETLFIQTRFGARPGQVKHHPPGDLPRRVRPAPRRSIPSICNRAGDTELTATGADARLRHPTSKIAPMPARTLVAGGIGPSRRAWIVASILVTGIGLGAASWASSRGTKALVRAMAALAIAPVARYLTRLGL